LETLPILLYSSIIINLPCDSILKATGSDDDGLNDYEEMFAYYTNPQIKTPGKLYCGYEHRSQEQAYICGKGGTFRIKDTEINFNETGYWYKIVILKFTG